MRIDILMISLFLLTLGTAGCSQPEPVHAEYEPADCNCAEESEAEQPPPARSDGLAETDRAEPAEATEPHDGDDLPAEALESAGPAVSAASAEVPPNDVDKKAADKKADKKDETAGNGDPNGVVNLNTASIDQLMALPGVGPALAARIVEFRQKRRFDEARHLLRVKGIGESTFAKLRPMLAVSGDTTLAK